MDCLRELRDSRFVTLARKIREPRLRDEVLLFSKRIFFPRAVRLENMPTSFRSSDSAMSSVAC